jgi:hypothetical protein
MSLPVVLMLQLVVSLYPTDKFEQSQRKFRGHNEPAKSVEEPLGYRGGLKQQRPPTLSKGEVAAA